MKENFRLLGWAALFSAALTVLGHLSGYYLDSHQTTSGVLNVITFAVLSPGILASAIVFHAHYSPKEFPSTVAAVWMFWSVVFFAATRLGLRLRRRAPAARASATPR